MQNGNSFHSNKFNRYNKYNKYNKRDKYSSQNRPKSYNTKKDEKKEFKLNENEFPDITSNKESEFKDKSEILDFKNINFEEVTEHKEESILKSGWIILNKENLEKRKNEKEKEKRDSENTIDIKKLNKAYNIMIDNWEKFRKEENILMGDRSRYINNDLEIKQMIEEEEYIKREIKDYNEDLKNNLIDKDNETNEINETNEYY